MCRELALHRLWPGYSPLPEVAVCRTTGEVHPTHRECLIYFGQFIYSLDVISARGTTQAVRRARIDWGVSSVHTRGNKTAVSAVEVLSTFSFFSPFFFGASNEEITGTLVFTPQSTRSCTPSHSRGRARCVVRCAQG